MRNHIIAIGLAVCGLSPTHALATSIGKEGFDTLKQCIMNNDAALCTQSITPDSEPLVRRFMSYRLMPCLPTNFSYVNEKTHNGFTVVRATMPAGGNQQHSFRLAFTGTPGHVKLDVINSLRMGLGEKWEEKINLAEQLYLLLQANSGGNLKCDQIAGLVRK